MIILGHGGGRQEGGKKWAGRGGIRIFPAGGGKYFLLQGGEGYCKIAKRALKCTLRHIFYDFYLQYGENFLLTKGGSIKNFLVTREGQ